MKRDFLKTLGIEDKEIIDKILDENSADIGRAKGELETYKTKVTELEAEIKTKDSEIETLTKSSGQVEELQNKVTQLEADNAKLKTDYEGETAELKKTHAIESAARDMKAKNVKAVVALLDRDKITFEDGNYVGLTEQLEGLQKGETTSFLFGEVTPSGLTPPNPPGGGGNPPTSSTFAEAVAKALSK
jgi:chromosome segregation ATPase